MLAFVLLGTSMTMVALVGLLAVELTEDLAFGDSGLGLAISAFWLVTAVTAPLAGRWVDRRGWPLGAALGAAVTGACLLACVFLVGSWGGLVAVLALAGAGYALCSPTSNLLVVRVVPRRRQASALGLKQTAPPLLLALAGATLPALAHQHGWRVAMAVGLVLPFAVGVGTWRLARRLDTGQAARPDDPAAPSHAAIGARRAPAAALRATPVVVAAGLGTLSVATVTGFAVLTLVGAGVDPVRAAGVVSLGSLLAVVARVVSGRFLDARPVADLTPLLGVMAAATAALATVAVGTLADVDGLVVAGVVLSLVAAWTWPALLLLTVVRLSSGPGAASGMLQLGSGLGSAVGPMGFGLLSAAGGRGIAWLVMAAATALAMVLVRRAGGDRGPSEVKASTM